MKVDKNFAVPSDLNNQVEKFVRYIMEGGKLSLARKIIRDCFDSLKEKGYANPLEYFAKALANVSPSVEVKAKRVGGAVYQIPVSVSEKRQFFLASRWILAGARSRKGMPISEKLTLEIVDAINETGYAFKKKNDVFNMAQSNKAFSHLSSL